MSQPSKRRPGLLARPHRCGVAAVAAVATGVMLAVAPAALAGASARSTAIPALARVAGRPALPDGATVLGALAQNIEISGAVALKLPDSTAVTDFIDNVGNPRSSLYHHFLAKGEFTRLFGPSRSTVKAVESQLRSGGLAVTGSSTNRLFVTFKGSTRAVESTFHTGLDRVRLATGALGRATTSAVRLPSSIAHDVQAVIGLNSLVREQDVATATEADASLARATGAHADRSKPSKLPSACAAASAFGAYGAISENHVADAYGVGGLWDGGDVAAGQTIDVYELQSFQMSDIAGFDECYYGASHTGQVTVTTVDGGGGTGNSEGVEADLDIEDISAFAPGAKIDVFEGPNMDNNWGPTDVWNAIAEADNASQISTSWGACETGLEQGAPGIQQVENEIFEQTAAQGQTVFAAAGDDGSDSCAYHDSSPVVPYLSLLDPAAQPYVTSVGGTTILDATEPPDETVWNNGNDGGGGGGGLSNVWQMPPWQSAVAVPQSVADEACSNDPKGVATDFQVAGTPSTLPAGTECRETPDVTALADPQTGVAIDYGGSWSQWGGTSSATPMWAAMLAEVNGSSSCKGSSVGFASPLLYDIASNPSEYAEAFNNVSVGNNDNLSLPLGGAIDWRAGKGYNMASGLGSPRLTNRNGTPGLAQLLCEAATRSAGSLPPNVTSLSSDSGPTAGGGTIAVRGSNFGKTKGAVYFGTVRASIVSWSNGSITVTVPRFTPPAGTPSGLGGSADVTVVTATPQKTSAIREAAVYHYTAVPYGGPIVDYVSAPTGPVAGGRIVHIVGSGFDGANSVTFGGVHAKSFRVLSDSEISAVVPADPTEKNCAVSASQGDCAVYVRVSTGRGTSAKAPILPTFQGVIQVTPDGVIILPPGEEEAPAPDEYDYAPTPTITSLSLTSGASEAGGSIEVITGSGFNLNTIEWLNVGSPGANLDFSVLAITSTELVVVLNGIAETVEAAPTPITVQTSGGLSNAATVVFSGIPVVKQISKHYAAQADPGTLTVTGAGISDVTGVEFLGVAPLNFLDSFTSNFVSQSDTSLTVDVPQFFSWPTDVLLCTASGCDAPNPNVDEFVLAYPGRPVLQASSPAKGPASGGTEVTIHGSLDSLITAIHFGSTLVPASDIVSEPEVTASGLIVVDAPPGKAGKTVPITISTIGGLLVGKPTSAVTRAASFHYTSSKSTGMQVMLTRGLSTTRR